MVVIRAAVVDWQLSYSIGVNRNLFLIGILETKIRFYTSYFPI